VDALVDGQLRVRQPAWTAAMVGCAAALLAGLLSPAAGVVVLARHPGGAPPEGRSRATAYAAAAPAFVATRAELAAEVEAFTGSVRSLALWQARSPRARMVDATGRRLASAGEGSVRAVARARLLVRLGCGLGVVAVAAAVPPGSVSPALLALLLLLPMALSDTLLPLPDAGAISVRVRAARERVDELLAAEPAVTDTVAAAPLPGLPAVLAAGSVDASWDTIPVLRGLDLHLRPGRPHRHWWARPGQGSRRWQALPGPLPRPDHGHGHSGLARQSASSPPTILRGVVTLVDDDPHVFASTVLENVRLARPDASDHDVRRALTDAGLGAVGRLAPGRDEHFVGRRPRRRVRRRARPAGHRPGAAGRPRRGGARRTDRSPRHRDGTRRRRRGARAGQRAYGALDHPGRVGLDLVDSVVVLGDAADASDPGGWVRCGNRPRAPLR
jgi:ATP-binding cassette subfamily C protein CydCD